VEAYGRLEKELCEILWQPSCISGSENLHVEGDLCAINNCVERTGTQICTYKYTNGARQLVGCVSGKETPNIECDTGPIKTSWSASCIPD